MRIIHVGVGGFGAHWANILANHEDADVVALVDINKEAIEAVQALHGYEDAICFDSLTGALEAVDADMVLCVTPPSKHLEQATEAMEAGLDVLVEKPLAGNLADCLAIVEAAERTGRTVAVCQNYRYKPEMQTVAGLVHAGEIGEVGQIRLDFYKGHYFDESNFRRTMPSPIIVDMAIHHFDLLRYITGQEPVTIEGRSWNPSWSDNAGDTSVALHMMLDNDAHFAYNASWCAQGDFADWNGNWLIEGDKGSIEYSQGVISLRRATEQYLTEKPQTIRIKNPKQNSQVAILSDFMSAVEAGTKPMTAVTDNLRSISAVFAALEATERQERMPGLAPEAAALLATSTR